MNRQHQINPEKGVSPVIGIILMVGISVALVAMVSVMVLDLETQPAKNAEATVNTEATDGNLTVTIVRNENIEDIKIRGAKNSPDMIDKEGETGTVTVEPKDSAENVEVVAIQDDKGDTSEQVLETVDADTIRETDSNGDTPPIVGSAMVESFEDTSYKTDWYIPRNEAGFSWSQSGMESNHKAHSAYIDANGIAQIYKNVTATNSSNYSYSAWVYQKDDSYDDMWFGWGTWNESDNSIDIVGSVNLNREITQNIHILTPSDTTHNGVNTGTTFPTGEWVKLTLSDVDRDNNTLNYSIVTASGSVVLENQYTYSESDSAEDIDTFYIMSPSHWSGSGEFYLDNITINQTAS